jgi:hypothetical protein
VSTRNRCDLDAVAFRVDAALGQKPSYAGNWVMTV